jgi:Ca-activated chloride channel family protein
MKLLWPGLLPLLSLVPILVLFYLWMLRRRRRYAVRYSNLSLIRKALPERSRWRRHLPAVLFLAGVTSVLVAVLRPAAEILVPLSRTTIILAIDVSRSMCATDVPPNRLSVAQEAAARFIDGQADNTRIGIVAFSDFAELIVPPTNDKKQLKQALESLTTSTGTAIGSATLKAIDAIAAVNPQVMPSGANLSGGSSGNAPSVTSYQPDIIVLLTDGANTRGPLPLDAANQAADRHLRVYTIGFGTTQFSKMVCTPQQMGGGIFSGFGQGGFGGFGFGNGGGGFGGRMGRFLLLDEPTLKAVAETTGGAYYRAENSDQLLQVFRDLPRQIDLQKQQTEITVAFVALAVVMILLAMALSLLWNKSL